MSDQGNYEISFKFMIPEYSTVPAGFVNITFGDPFLDKTKNLAVMIDTGYDGYLVLPIKQFNELELFKYLMPNTTVIGEIADGRILEFSVAKGRIQIPEIKFDMIIEIDTFEECTTPLIGREFINQLTTIFEGKHKNLKVING